MGLRRNPHSHVRGLVLIFRRESKNDFFLPLSPTSGSRTRLAAALFPIGPYPLRISPSSLLAKDRALKSVRCTPPVRAIHSEELPAGSGRDCQTMNGVYWTEVQTTLLAVHSRTSDPTFPRRLRTASVTVSVRLPGVRPPVSPREVAT